MIMATRSRRRRGAGTPLKLTDEDFKRKSFKTAPAGTYDLRGSKKETKIKPGNKGHDIAQLCWTITKGPHKGVNIFDNVDPEVGWKVGQTLAALGYTPKTAKGKTLEDIVDEVSAGAEAKGIVRVRRFEGKKRNEIAQLLPKGAKIEEDDVEDIDDEEEEDEALDADEDDLTEDNEDELPEDEEDAEDEDEEEDETDEEDEDEADEDEEEDEEDEDEDEDDLEDEDDEDEDDEDEEDEDEEEEEEEEEEAPARRRAPAKRAPAKRAPAKRGGRKAR
jgi:hypothetical protein